MSALKVKKTVTMNTSLETPYEALLVGRVSNSLMALPKLLARSGFSVDIVTTLSQINMLRPVRQINTVEDEAQLLSSAAQAISHPYDLVVITDDDTLRLVVASDLCMRIKLQLLPVRSFADFSHVGSKIGLSKCLAKHGVPTPTFSIVNSVTELHQLLSDNPRDLMLKNDRSGGGVGIFKHKSRTDVASTEALPIRYPLLVQRYIEGELLDMSGFYQNGQLIHFSFSEMLIVVNNEYGPSSVRQYHQLSEVPRDAFVQLEKMGRAIGAHGFVNTSCIRCHATGQFFIIEADVRPNGWVDHSEYIGDDPAVAIRAYFDHGQILAFPQNINHAYPARRIVPLYLRLKVWEIVCNRHAAWSYLGRLSRHELLVFLILRIRSSLASLISKKIKPLLGERNWKRVKRLRQAIISKIRKN